jgi:hypothetical protein
VELHQQRRRSHQRLIGDRSIADFGVSDGQSIDILRSGRLRNGHVPQLAAFSACPHSSPTQIKEKQHVLWLRNKSSRLLQLRSNARWLQL